MRAFFAAGFATGNTGGPQDFAAWQQEIRSISNEANRKICEELKMESVSQSKLHNNARAFADAGRKLPENTPEEMMNIFLTGASPRKSRKRSAAPVDV